MAVMSLGSAMFGSLIQISELSESKLRFFDIIEWN